MRTISFLVLIATCVLVPSAWAQEEKSVMTDPATEVEAGPSDTADTATAETSDADAAEASAAAEPQAATTDTPAWMLERFERMELVVQRLLAAERRIDELTAQLEEMEVLRAKVATLEAQLADVGKIAQTEADNSLGRMAEDPVLRTELGRAMQGKLNLTNSLGVQKVIYINGTAWTVRTGESYVYVPVGKISIQESLDAVPTFIDLDKWTSDAGQLAASYEVK